MNNQLKMTLCLRFVKGNTLLTCYMMFVLHELKNAEREWNYTCEGLYVVVMGL
jgi:hypothetical protein